MMVFIVSSFLESLPYLFQIPGVTCFLSEKLSQDPIEKFFGCQCQKGRSNENPTVAEFFKTLRVINSIDVREITGNCRGTKRKFYNLETSQLNALLKEKRKCRHSK